MKPYVKFTRNGYGFGYDWTLVIPKTKTLPEQEFFMGQEAKVKQRILGYSGMSLAAEICKRTGQEFRHPLPWTQTVAEALAAIIIEAFGGLRQVRTLEPWALHAGGG